MSERRTTYTNTQKFGDTVVQRIGIHTTNSTDKTFICPNGAGISTCGDASAHYRVYIQEMIFTKIGVYCCVSAIPQIIIDYFNTSSCLPNTIFSSLVMKQNAQLNQMLYNVNVNLKL